MILLRCALSCANLGNMIFYSSIAPVLPPSRTALVKEKLAEIGHTFARSIRDSVKAQLQLMADVGSLVATPDSDLEARADALLDEHHRDPEYLAHLRKAVTSKLERERRLVQHLREDADQENPERPTEEYTADKLVRYVRDSFISSRERKLSRLERLKSLLDEPGLAYDPGELPARGDDLIGLDPEPDETGDADEPGE